MQVTSDSNSKVLSLLDRIKEAEEQIQAGSSIDDGRFLSYFVNSTQSLYKEFSSLSGRVTSEEESNLFDSLERYRQAANSIFGEIIDEHRAIFINQIYNKLLKSTTLIDKAPPTFFDSQLNSPKNHFNKIKSETHALLEIVNAASRIVDEINELFFESNRLKNSLEHLLLCLDLGNIDKEHTSESPYNLIDFSFFIKFGIEINSLITLKSMTNLRKELKEIHIQFIKIFSFMLTKPIRGKETIHEILTYINTYKTLKIKTEKLIEALQSQEQNLFHLKKETTADAVNSYVDFFLEKILDDPESLNLCLDSIDLRKKYNQIKTELKSNKKKKKDSLSVHLDEKYLSKNEKINRILEVLEREIFPYDTPKINLIDDLVKTHFTHFIFCLIMFEQIKVDTSNYSLNTLQRFLREIIPQLLFSIDTSLKIIEEGSWSDHLELLIFLEASTEIIKENSDILESTDLEIKRLYSHVQTLVEKFIISEPKKEFMWTNHLRPFSKKILGSAALEHIIQNSPPYIDFSKISHEPANTISDDAYVVLSTSNTDYYDTSTAIPTPPRFDDLSHRKRLTQQTKSLLDNPEYFHPDLTESILKDADLCAAIVGDLREYETLPSLQFPPVGVPNFGSICYRTASLQIALPLLVQFMNPTSLIKKWKLFNDENIDLHSTKRQLQVSNALKSYLDSQAYLEKNNIDLENRALWLTKADEDLATALIESAFMYDLTEETRYSQQDAAAFLEALLGDILNQKIIFEDRRTVLFEDRKLSLDYTDSDTLLRLPVDEANTLEEAIHHLCEEKQVNDPDNKIKRMIDEKEIEFEEYTKQTRIIGELPHHLFIHMKRRLYEPTGEYVYSQRPLKPPKDFIVDLSPISKNDAIEHKYLIKGFIEFSQLGTDSGHYTAYVQRENTQWYHVNDFTVTEVTQENVEKALETAYIIALEKIPAETQV